ncbi:hypothetical protein ACMH5Q_00720 [Aquirufa lenticrescens]
MAKSIQDQLAEKVKDKFPEAEVKKINKDNFLDIHLPGVHPKRGTHLFFNTSAGAIKVGFYCREEEFTQKILVKNASLEAYSQGVRPKGNPEWKTVDSASSAALVFVESLSGTSFPSSSSATSSVSSSNGMGKLFQRIKAAYPKCSVNEEKNYVSFTFKAAFLYELRIQKGSIRLLAANYPQKASVAQILELIAQHKLTKKMIQDCYPLIVEQGKVSPDKLTIRIEIPYKSADFENDSFIANLITICAHFHAALSPLINGFQPQPIGKLQEVMGGGAAVTNTSVTDQKKETPAATVSKETGLSSFDLTEFDLTTFGLEGKPESKTPATPVPQGKPADPSVADESEFCFDDPIPFLTGIQLLRNYFLVLSSESKAYRASFEAILREFAISAVVPRISDDMLRLVHEDGNLIESLLLSPMLKAEEIYDKDYDTHDDYVRSLAGLVDELLPFCNTGLFLDTLEFFMYLGEMLEEEESPSGSLNAQDRYFPLFLMLKASPEQDLENLEIVFSKDAKPRNAKSGCDVKELVLKASGNFNQLSNEEKLGLILYDFILWDEKPGLDIKIGDVAAAKSIFANVTQNAALGEKLLGGFEDNASFEIFQFFNVEFNREGFHEFCLARWKELSSEWNPLKLQLLIECVRRDFHPNTYINNPVLEDYLNTYKGVKAVDLAVNPTTVKEEEQTEEDGGPFILDEKKKTLEITSLPHCILFVILQVGFKLDNYTPEEMADIKSTAVSLGDWFDLDQDECLEVLDEILDLLIKCKSIFNLKELGNLVSATCLVIHSEITNEGVRGDIVRFMNDLANADGKVTKEEESNLLFYSVLINYGGSMFN